MYACRIVVALRPVVDRSHKTVGFGGGIRDGLAQVMRKGRDSALARQVIAEKGDTLR